MSDMAVRAQPCLIKWSVADLLGPVDVITTKVARRKGASAGNTIFGMLKSFFGMT
jgi:hypothetical protein